MQGLSTGGDLSLLIPLTHQTGVNAEFRKDKAVSQGLTDMLVVPKLVGLGI